MWRTVDVRVDLPDSAILTRYSKPHPDGALVTHICGPTARPLRLHIAHAPRHALIAPIYEQRNTDVDFFRDERVSLLVGRVRLDLREDEGVPALDN